MREKRSKSIQLDRLTTEYSAMKLKQKELEKAIKAQAKEMKKFLTLDTLTTTISGEIIEYSETMSRGFSHDAKKALKLKLNSEQFWTIFNPTIKELKKVFSDIEISVLADLITYGDRIKIKK